MPDPNALPAQVPIVAEYRGEWSDFDAWCDRARYEIGPDSGIEHYLCIDAKNRICWTGKQFMRARDEGTFPVKFYETAAPQGVQAQEEA